VGMVMVVVECHIKIHQTGEVWEEGVV